MDFTRRLSVSYYKAIAVIDESHKIDLVQHQETHRIFIRKVLDVYNADLYEYLSLHPLAGTPKIIALCEENHQLTVIEEYISGSVLEDKIRQHSLSCSDMIRYMLDLCTVLQALHHTDPPIIHRDIKPSNVIIDCWNHAVLLDFNAAKFYSPDSTEDTVLLGTMGYAAPEQYGFGSSSPKTDIYALGVLLQKMSDSMPKPCHVFDDVIETCTKLNAAERYSSVHELRRHLEGLTNPAHGRRFSRGLQKYALPGFRSHTPWKMLLASVYYLFVFFFCTAFHVNGMNGPALLICYLCLLGISLSWVFSCFNYRNIQCMIPLCKHRHPVVRRFGMFILTLAIVLVSFLVLFITHAVAAVPS